jgi:hypothetical protein
MAHSLSRIGPQNIPLPDFMTRARRELIVSLDFLALAILTEGDCLTAVVLVGWLAGWRVGGSVLKRSRRDEECNF